LEEAICFLQSQLAQVGNDEQWQAQGYPLGNSFVEQAVAIVINLRLRNVGCDGNWPKRLLPSRCEFNCSIRIGKPLLSTRLVVEPSCSLLLDKLALLTYNQLI